MTSAGRIVASGIGTVALAILGAGAVWATTESWGPWRPATCMPDRCFCEAIRSGLVLQPANTLSSLSFVFVGLLVIATGYTTLNTQSSKNAAIDGLSGYTLVYAGALIVVGLGSAFYHASLSFVGQFADVMGMYFIASFVILYSFGRIRALRPITIVTSYVFANGALAWVLFAAPALRRYIFAAVLLTGLLVEYIARSRVDRSLNSRRLLMALGFLVSGFGIWILDITKTVCKPDAAIQGHAIWHVAGAIASWQLYAYYRSEQFPQTLRSETLHAADDVFRQMFFGRKP
jgi:hypothetical protein